MNESQHCRFTILGTTLFFLSVDIVSAEDLPQTGAVYNTKDVRELTYKCNQIDAPVIDCDFIETGVRKESKPLSWKPSSRPPVQNFAQE